MANLEKWIKKIGRDWLQECTNILQWEYSKPFKAAYLVALHIHEHQTIVSYLIGKVNVIHWYCMQIIPSIGAPQRDLVSPKKPRKYYKSIKHSVKQLYLSKNKI